MASYQRLPAVERTLLGGRLLVQPVGAPAPTELGGSAPIIWELLETHQHLDVVMELLADRFNDEPAVIEHGTRQAVEQLLSAGLIERQT
jgi:hypothetical protein